MISILNYTFTISYDNGKKSNISESNKLEANLKHIINLAGVERISIYPNLKTG